MDFLDRLMWKDAKPIAPLAICVLIAQLVGAGAGYKIALSQEVFQNIWNGGALATPIGFIVGFMIQAGRWPESISENKKIIINLAVASLGLGAVAYLRITGKM